MDSNMMRFWGRRSVYDDRQFGDDPDSASEDDEQKALRQRGKLMTISEESSQELMSHHTNENSNHVHGSEYGEEETGEEEKNDDHLNDQEQAQLRKYNLHRSVEAVEPISDHDEEVTHDDIHPPSAQHTVFGLHAEDLMLKNSIASPTGGKYRTVSVFGGVFALPPDPVDSDDCSLSSASDGFSSDEDDSPNLRSQKPRNPIGRISTSTIISPSISRQTTPKRTTNTPRVVSPPFVASSVPMEDTKVSATDSSSTASNASNISPRSGISPTIRDNSMARALKAFDETDSLLSKLLKELESSPFHAVAPEGVEETITTLQASKQTLQSVLHLDDFVLTC